MSTTVKTGWLKDKNGDKFAPKTYTSQVLEYGDTPLDEKLQKIDKELENIENVVKSPLKADIGQQLVVKEVDENGKPIDWEYVDRPCYIDELEVLFDESIHFSDGSLQRDIVAYPMNHKFAENLKLVLGESYLVQTDNGSTLVMCKYLSSRLCLDVSSITYLNYGSEYIHIFEDGIDAYDMMPYTMSLKITHVKVKYLDADLIPELAEKLNKPSSDGSSGYVLMSNGYGGTYWGSIDINSYLSNYVKNTDYATSSKAGLVRTNSTYGTYMSGQYIQTYSALQSDIDSKTSDYRPITPNRLDYAVKSGLSNNKLTWTETEKQNARNLIGAVSIDDIPEQSSSVQADWNQNDETADDYIKNRPFYKYKTTGNGLAFGMPSNGVMNLNLENPLEYNKEYLVRVGRLDVITMCGETVQIDEQYHAFAGESLTLETTHLLINSIPGLYVEVYELVDGFSTIDENYIPNTIARQKDIVQSDWGQTDEIQYDYIKNKPFYEYKSLETIFEKQEITLTKFGSAMCYEFSNPLPIKKGDECIITIYDWYADGSRTATIICEDINFKSDNLIADIYFTSNHIEMGDLGLGTDTMTCSIELSAYVNKSKPLEEKFIPDNIPKVQSATVGQILSVKAIDENGKPTEWEVIDNNSAQIQADMKQADKNAPDYVKNQLVYDFAMSTEYGDSEYYQCNVVDIPKYGITVIKDLSTVPSSVLNYYTYEYNCDVTKSPYMKISWNVKSSTYSHGFSSTNSLKEKIDSVNTKITINSTQGLYIYLITNSSVLTDEYKELFSTNGVYLQATNESYVGDLAKTTNISVEFHKIKILTKRYLDRNLLYTEDKDEILKEIDEKISTPTTASVGQILSVKSVDENNKPTEWETIDKPTGGSGDAEVIIDVVELPTENINDKALYRVLTGTFVYNGLVDNTINCFCVEELPETGIPATDAEVSTVNVYYNLQDGEVYGYVDDMLSMGLGVPVGWYPIGGLFEIVGTSYGGVMTDLKDASAEDTLYLLLEKEIYYWNDKWVSLKSVGYHGTGSNSEIHNSNLNIASGQFAFAEGFGTEASGEASHAEGDSTEASGYRSHAEGASTIASGRDSHAEGASTIASRDCSHAEGDSTTASGDCSHAEGMGTKANGINQHVQGRYNIEDTENKYAHIVGNGYYREPSNAHTLDWNGNAEFQGDVIANGCGGENPISLVGLSEEVEELKQNGTGNVDLSEYVKKTDYAGKDNAGVVRVYPSSDKNVPGVGISGNNIIGIVAATNANIDAKETKNPIVPTNLDYAIKSGLTTNGIEWTEEEKQAARELIGAGTGSGKDGFSPIATVKQTNTGATISIEDKNGTTTAAINHGKDGKDGKTPYIDEDGYISYGDPIGTISKTLLGEVVVTGHRKIQPLSIDYATGVITVDDCSFLPSENVRYTHSKVCIRKHTEVFSPNNVIPSELYTGLGVEKISDNTLYLYSNNTKIESYAENSAIDLSAWYIEYSDVNHGSIAIDLSGVEYGNHLEVEVFGASTEITTVTGLYVDVTDKDNVRYLNYGATNGIRASTGADDYSFDSVRSLYIGKRKGNVMPSRYSYDLRVDNDFIYVVAKNIVAYSDSDDKIPVYSIAEKAFMVKNNGLKTFKLSQGTQYMMLGDGSYLRIWEVHD